MKNKIPSSVHGEITLSNCDRATAFSYGGRRKCLGVILLWCFLCITPYPSYAQNANSHTSKTQNSTKQTVSDKLFDSLGLVQNELSSSSSSTSSTDNLTAQENGSGAEADAANAAAAAADSNSLPLSSNNKTDDEYTDEPYADDAGFIEPFSGEGEFVKAVVNDRSVLPPEKIKFIDRPTDSELFVEVLVNDLIFDQAMVVYLDEDKLIVPLSAIADILGFPIHVTPSLGTAEGWFLREDNKFSLSPPYSMISIADQTSPVKGGIVEPHIDDIYVSIDLLSKWFPADFSFNFNELRLHIEPHADLPFMEEAKRKAAWDEIKSRKAEKDDTIKGPVIKLPHRMVAAPVLQLNHDVNYSNKAKISNLATSHAIQAQGDLAGMNLRASMNVTTKTSTNLKEISAVSVNLGKEDYDGNIGGILKATKLQIGDVNTTPAPMTGGGTGRGIAISNEPYNFVRDPSDFTVDGYGPIGWDVEVYQDQNLLDFQTIDDSGQYSFSALTLREGFNLLRIVLYGPNGEIRERSERFYIGRNMVPTGKFIYDLTALESSTPLLDFRANPAKSTPHTFSFLGEYGVNEKLSVSGGLYQGRIGAYQTNAINAGFRASTKSTMNQFSYLRTNGGAASASLNTLGNFGKKTSWRFGYTQHNGYEQNVRSFKKQTIVRLSQPLPMILNGNYSIKATQEESNSGKKTRLYENKLSLNVFGMNLINNLTYLQHLNATTASSLTGDLTLRRSIKGGYIRGALNYDIYSKLDKLKSADIYMQRRISEKLSSSVRLAADFTANNKYTLEGKLSLQKDKVKIGLNTAADTDGDYSIGVTMAYNFVPQNIYGDYYMTENSSQLTSGHIIVRPFLDANQNNLLDEGEKGLDGVIVKNLLRGTTVKSKADGGVVLGGLAPNVMNKITIDTKSLPDIYMVPKFEYINIIGKKGINGPLNLPIISLGEISGMLGYIDINGEFTALADTTIVVLDKKKRVVAETDSEYDGFYMFPSLPMGEYEMFFPKSDILNKIYLGNGNGPRFKLNIDEPEVYDADVVVTSENIKFKESLE